MLNLPAALSSSSLLASSSLVFFTSFPFLFPLPAHGFIEDIINQAFGGGGGGGFHFEMGGGGGGGRHFHMLNEMGGGGGQRRMEEAKFPPGVEDRVDKVFNWLRGTEWYWNRWDNVKFNKDGSFEARTQSCMVSGQCKWSAYIHENEPKIFVMWGSDGLHTMKVHGPMPKMQGVEELQTIELVGHRARDNREPSRKKEPCSAVFDKVYDHEAFKNSIDLYELLGLSEKQERGEVITPAEIKKAYRKLSLQYHPDKNTDPAVIAMYQEMTAAYEVLSDDEKRARYDCCGMEGVKGEMPTGESMALAKSVTLEELYSGKERVDHVSRRVICRVCRSDPSNPKCAQCGQCPPEIKMVQSQIGPGMIIQQQKQVKSKDKCKQEQAKLNTEIVRGMRDGDKIEFKHMAEQSPGQLPGDVVIVLQQQKHRKFERKANDLHMTMKLSLQEALLGFTRKITHLDEHIVTVSHDGITAPFQVYRVESEGMPYRDDPTRFGHLYIKAEIEMPKKLTQQQRELAQQMFAGDKPPKEEL